MSYTTVYFPVQCSRQVHVWHTYSALKPLTWRIRICFTMVLFPDSPAPARQRGGEEEFINSEGVWNSIKRGILTISNVWLLYRAHTSWIHCNSQPIGMWAKLHHIPLTPKRMLTKSRSATDPTVPAIRHLFSQVNNVKCNHCSDSTT